MTDLNGDAVRRILEAGTAFSSAANLEPGDRGVLAAVVPQGYTIATREYDVEGDRPRRRSGVVAVDDVISFAAYFLKHRQATSEVYASIDDSGEGRIVAVLNASGGTDDLADWRDHRVILDLDPTVEWTRWIGGNGRLFAQQDFAELVEAGLSQIEPHPVEGGPVAADMLEVAQTLTGSTRVEWESATRIDNGQTRLAYRETTEASTKGGLEIPSEFWLLLRPWRATLDAIRVKARLRYRIQGGQASLGYALADLDLRVEDATRALLSELDSALNGDAETGRLQILRGTP